MADTSKSSPKEKNEVPNSPTTFNELYAKLSDKKQKLKKDRIPLKQKRDETFESFKASEAALIAVQNEIVAINNSIYQLVTLHHPPTSFDDNGHESYSYDNSYLKFDRRSVNNCESTNRTEWIATTAKKF